MGLLTYRRLSFLLCHFPLQNDCEQLLSKDVSFCVPKLHRIIFGPSTVGLMYFCSDYCITTVITTCVCVCVYLIIQVSIEQQRQRHHKHSMGYFLYRFIYDAYQRGLRAFRMICYEFQFIQYVNHLQNVRYVTNSNLL